MPNRFETRYTSTRRVLRDNQDLPTMTGKHLNAVVMVNSNPPYIYTRCLTSCLSSILARLITVPTNGISSCALSWLSSTTCISILLERIPGLRRMLNDTEAYCTSQQLDDAYITWELPFGGRLAQNWRGRWAPWDTGRRLTSGSIRKSGICYIAGVFSHPWFDSRIHALRALRALISV